MITALTALNGALTALLVPFFGLLALVTGLALWPRRPRAAVPSPTGPSPSTRFLFVIPAHDEAANIAATVGSCRQVGYPAKSFAVAVIADNCSDATAVVARQAGAEVFERRDTARRSKGHALETFFNHRHTYGPNDHDAVVIIDADTVVDPALLTYLDEAIRAGHDWLQAYYTVRNPDASWRTRLLTYALSLFNGVWLLGQDRLGLGVGFRGNGMALTRRGLARVPWKAYGLVEDQEFSWVLRVAGESVHFVPEARVYAEMVTRGSAAVSQRRRWEDGRRSLRRRFRDAIWRAPSWTATHRLLAAIDLEFPPLTTLLGLLAAALALDLGSFALGSHASLLFARTLMMIHGIMAVIFASYLLTPFLTLGLPWRYLTSLIHVPQYAIWKVLALVGRRSGGWIRTQREAPTSSP